MKIFIINLASSTDRRESMRKQMQALNLDYEIFSATDGKHLPQEYREFCYADTLNMLLGNPGFYNDNEIACFASHYRLWQHCCKLNEPVIIVEDDVKLSPNFKQKMPQIIKLLKQLNYLRLSALEIDRPVVTVHESLNCYLFYPLGSQGYALTPSGAQQLIKEAKHWTKPLDMYLDMYWQHGLRPYCVNPLLIVHDTNFISEIDNASVRDKQYLPKASGLIKLCRELFIRPWQQCKKAWFEFMHPIISQEQIEKCLSH